jgi:hypothetical protein
LKYWDVFLLFLIPVGGGIPAGLVLAQGRGIPWPTTMVLYFFSDIIQAFIFEGIVILFRFGARHSVKLERFVTALKQSTQKTISRYSLRPGPFALVMIAFGVDPLTGRTAALAAGHGFITGWLLAISGDMIFFTVIMVSTLWLNSILGDGTVTAVSMMVAMMVVPAIIRRVRDRLRNRAPASPLS